MNQWVYIRTEIKMFVVGFYDPNGKFYADSYHNTRAAAADQCAYLNGQSREKSKKSSEFKSLKYRIKALEDKQALQKALSKSLTAMSI